MRLNLLIIFIVCSGCFAIAIPEPGRGTIPKQTSLNHSATAIYTPDFNEVPTFERNILERLAGKDSVGHQYVFFLIPVTRLYLERGTNEMLREFALTNPVLGSGDKIATNLSYQDFRALVGANIPYYDLELISLSASVYDLFIFRKISIRGEMRIGESFIPIRSSEYSKTGAPEEISALLESALLNSLIGVIQRDKRSELSALSSAATLICPPSIETTAEHINIVDIQRGWEEYFRETHKPFISFRTACPARLQLPHYKLSGEDLKININRDDIVISGTMRLKEAAISGERLLLKRALDTACPIEWRATDSLGITHERAGKKFLREFFDDPGA